MHPSPRWKVFIIGFLKLYQLIRRNVVLRILAFLHNHRNRNCHRHEPTHRQERLPDRWLFPTIQDTRIFKKHCANLLRKSYLRVILPVDSA